MDLVLWGATGFTGRLTARYLVEKAPSHLQLGIAGRNLQKLENLKQELETLNPNRKVELIVADIGNESSIEEMVRKTKVICSTAGPFIHYSLLVAQTCARLGKHYCDITGEPNFVRKVIDSCNEEAQRTGACIVSCCGYDSIPSDLGTWMVVDYVKRVLNRIPGQTKCLVKGKGGMSGGTFTSLLEVMDTPASGEIRRNPYYLNDNIDHQGKDTTERLLPKYDKTAKKWTSLWVMSFINTRVVRRSAEKLGYGPSFSYEEVFSCRNFLYCMTLSSFLLLGVFLLFRPFRNLARRFGPKSGEGPSEEERKSGFFKAEIFCEALPNQSTTNEKPLLVKGLVQGYEDPGYNSTAKMVAESAICLTENPRVQGGVYPPAVVMGSTLIERLRVAGIDFKILDQNNN